MSQGRISRKPPHRLKAPTLAQLFDTTFHPRLPLLEPWLRTGESVMVFAPPGVGKSMMTLSLALAVAGGGSYLGWKAPEARRVLLVDGEMHIQDITDRARLLLPTLDSVDDQAAPDNITVLARQYQHPESTFPDLATDEGREVIMKRTIDGGYDLVILDNFSTLATVDDENAASAFDPVIKFLLKLKQAGVACILVHHSNKGGNDFRGSSKLATTFEVIIGLKKPESGERRHGTAFDLDWQKYRQQRDENITGRAVWLSKERSGKLAWKYELSQDEECIELVRLIRTLEYISQEELATAMICSTGKLSKLKSRATHQLKLITKIEWDEAISAARALKQEDNSDF
jgi:hypothetical protein